MEGKDELGRRGRDRVERAQHLPETRLVVGVFRSMDRHHAVATRFQSEAFENPGALRGQATVEQHGVVHDVAGEDRALAEPLLF